MVTVTAFPGWEKYNYIFQNEAEAIAHVQDYIDNPPPSRPEEKIRRLVKKAEPSGAYRWVVEETTYSGVPVLQFNPAHPDDVSWTFPEIGVSS